MLEVIKKFTRVSYNRPVVALGMFDGVHVGHASIIHRAVEISRDIDGTAMVLTFSNHPLSVIAPENVPLAVGNKILRREIFESLGVQVLMEIPFTKELSRKTPEEFLEMLRDRIAPAYVVTGPNYTFGRFGRGNGRMLIREGENYGFKAEVCPAVTLGKKIVSSTKIRALIAEGDLSAANELLGHEFTYTSQVVHGDRRGRNLGYPTANLEIDDSHSMLPNGVYLVRVKIGDEIFNGIANIGDNPTFKVAKRRLEVFIDNFSREIYGENISVIFIEKIRDEKTFASIEDLKAQLRADLAELRIKTSAP